MEKRPFQATHIWTSIISNLHTHVEVKQRRHNLKSYHDCFLGSEAVDVVLAHLTLSRFFGAETVPRFKAVRLCQALMNAKVFEPVGVRVFGKEKKRVVFEDSSCSLYRFMNPDSDSPSPPTDANVNQTSTTETSSSSTTRNPKSKSRHKGLRERKEVPSYSTHSPVKKLKSLEDELGTLELSSSISSPVSPLTPSDKCLQEVWHQQALASLLQLIQLPFLESSLRCMEPQPQPAPADQDSDPDLLFKSSYLDREVLKAFSEAHADKWMSGAVDCLEFLPDNLVVEVSRGLAAFADDLHQCKKLLYQVLARHYAHVQQPPLLNNHIFDIYSGISELLVNGKLQRALQAVQLSVKLQDPRSNEELRRLLKFMATAAKSQEVKLLEEVENRMAVKRSFSRAIVHSSRLPKGKVDFLILFLMDSHQDLFEIPAPLQELVNERIVNIMNGKDPDVITGLPDCKTATGCSDNAGKTTKEELLSLLQTVHESQQIPTKNKKRLLGQFCKIYPQIFVQYFGKKLSTFNTMPD